MVPAPAGVDRTAIESGLPPELARQLEHVDVWTEPGRRGGGEAARRRGTWTLVRRRF
ncbi:MAG: hypothetical protein M5U26_03525 [Planctomycetota bacterium]|nr:hypothetical protein [Planctomycetota bacterium]